MTTTIADLLGSDTLPAEMLTALQEAFDAKVEEVKQIALTEAEANIREEMAARFNHDKETLVMAMNQMLTNVVKENARAKSKELAKLTESRRKLDETTKATKKFYAEKLREHVDLSSTFIAEQLKKGVTDLNTKAKKLAEKQASLESAYSKLKTTLAEQQAARIQKMDEFVVRRVTAELNEFQQDKRALNETRVKLMKEGKAKMKATQDAFVTESAKLVDKTMTAALKAEMKEIHEDIERNRQNTFGRRIFEAMAAEFMTSYLAEGTEIRKLQNVLESKEKELSAAKEQLAESAKVAEAAARKEKLAEDRAERTKVLGELLGSLKGEKRATMASLLETVKTDKLRSAYDRYMPVVLSEGSSKPTADRKQALNETRKPARRTVEVSGDKPVRIVESDSSNEENEFLGSIVRLAGINK